MNSFTKTSLSALAVLLGTSAVVGCGSDNSITKDELDRVKASKMTDEARARMAQGMQEGANKAREQELQWAKDHPNDVARVNAERAKMGRPPLGG